MKRIFLLLTCVGIGWNGLQAQTSDDTLGLDLSAITWQLDSLLPCYQYPAPDSAEFHRDSLNVYGYAPDSMPPYNSEMVAQRLLDIGSPIDLAYNEYVQSYINLYVIQRREQVERMLGLSYLYFPMFEAELDRQGMPMELKYLPVVESALNPHATSRVGATGLWQFMLATGRMYKLDVTSYVDERRDPEKATVAAVQYLKNMYKTYGDWLLVIAAYNCGPGNVNKALARSKGGRTFWEIREHLPRETRGYVPAFIAATYVFNYATEHNLFPRQVDFSFQQDTVHFTRQKISLKHLAELTDTDFYLLRDLNPELKADMVPYQAEPYVLRVPMRTAQFIAAHRDSLNHVIAQVNPDTAKVTIAENKVSPLTNRAYEQPAKAGSDNATQIAGRTLVYHKVREGEVVSTIAERYHVSWKQIGHWNNLRGYRIKPGQSLKIYVPNKYASSVTKSSTPAPPKTTPAPVKIDGAKYHVVRTGDTLWDIANAYEGLTVTRIKELNNLESNRLKIGQQLRIE